MIFPEWAPNDLVWWHEELVKAEMDKRQSFAKTVDIQYERVKRKDLSLPGGAEELEKVRGKEIINNTMKAPLPIDEDASEAEFRSQMWRGLGHFHFADHPPLLLRLLTESKMQDVWKTLLSHPAIDSSKVTPNEIFNMICKEMVAAFGSSPKTTRQRRLHMLAIAKCACKLSELLPQAPAFDEMPLVVAGGRPLEEVCSELRAYFACPLQGNPQIEAKEVLGIILDLVPDPRHAVQTIHLKAIEALLALRTEKDQTVASRTKYLRPLLGTYCLRDLALRFTTVATLTMICFQRKLEIDGKDVRRWAAPPSATGKKKA
ncbi:MAG: hypothetical protein IPP88_09340 [Betaproteobacteria bacterium]|nr:hypothetical protein [Betaproteobacteria bacterium]